ncbi:hypothetical protein F5X98DRAFT_17701 [Xylaria grammica]|nr:hypothetical protein F5X98DRAFT_17701 [Xylaria grammica]
MQRPETQAPPFRVRILKQLSDNPAVVPSGDVDLASLLPASFRTKNDDLTPPKLDNTAYLEKELSVKRLDDLSAWLWVAGRPMPPRPLHYQLVLGRQTVIVEQMDLHLVWTSGRIFLKPIPRYLLEPDFWTTYLSCQHQPPCAEATKSPCVHRKLWRCALGFLFSYVALICYESDFRLAQDRQLLPENIRWSDWRELVEQLDTEHIYGKIDARYIYGELRLSRLNKVQLLHSSSNSFRGYMLSWNRYGDFFNENFTWLASATVYVAIVLTAMQVGLATDALHANGAFQSASYGFTVFSIIGPLAAAGLIVFVFICVFISNWVATVVYRRKRLAHIEVNSGVA